MVNESIVYKQERVNCPYCENDYSKGNLKRHMGTCPERKDEPISYVALNNSLKERDIQVNKSDTFDQLRLLRDLFPKIYSILTPDQIKKFLDEV